MRFKGLRPSALFYKHLGEKVDTKIKQYYLPILTWVIDTIYYYSNRKTNNTSKDFRVRLKEI